MSKGKFVREEDLRLALMRYFRFNAEVETGEDYEDEDFESDAAFFINRLPVFIGEVDTICRDCVHYDPKSIYCRFKKKEVGIFDTCSVKNFNGE